MHFLDDRIPFSPLLQFSTESLFNERAAREALLSMAYYNGYLTYEYPRHAEYGDCLVAPNDDMREVFAGAVMNHLPEACKLMAKSLMEKGIPKVVAVKQVYMEAAKGLGLPQGA